MIQEPGEADVSYKTEMAMLTRVKMCRCAYPITCNIRIREYGGVSRVANEFASANHGCKRKRRGEMIL
jgi:hypothetical protein